MKRMKSSEPGAALEVVGRRGDAVGGGCERGPASRSDGARAETREERDWILVSGDPSPSAAGRTARRDRRAELIASAEALRMRC